MYNFIQIDPNLIQLLVLVFFSFIMGSVLTAVITITINPIIRNNNSLTQQEPKPKTKIEDTAEHKSANSISPQRASNNNKVKKEVKEEPVAKPKKELDEEMLRLGTRLQKMVDKGSSH